MERKKTRGLLAAALAVSAFGLAAAPASAATVVVNTTTDQSLGSCSSSCSLRDAVATANPGDTVQVPAGHYVLTLGDIISANSLTIAGARSTVLDGNGASRIFQFSNQNGPQTVELDDLSLINGVAATPDADFGAFIGGALTGNTSLTLRRCRFAGNQAQAGGAIFAFANLTVDQCTIVGNLATPGLGIEGLGGGGILALNDVVTITNSTLSGNTASPGLFGGGAALAGPVGSSTLVNVTITANQASAGMGGGLIFLDGSIAHNSIVAGNVGGDCFNFGSPGASDHNLDSDNSCGFTDAGSHTGVPALLGPLANNGGPTDTQALLSGSPALDAGNNATCLATDQRGVTRPQGPACDIGAFELFTPLTPQDQIAALLAQINALVTGGSLAQNKANPLITKLNQVVTKLNGGQTTAACGQLGAFINQLNADIGNGTLTQAQGQPLLDAVNTLQASLGC